MSNLRDPRRLELEGSSEMKTLLETLRADGPSADSMRQMAKALGPQLDAPVQPPSLTAKLLATYSGKLLLLAFAALLTLVPFALRKPTTPRQQASESSAPNAALRSVERAVPDSVPKVAEPTVTPPQPRDEATPLQATPKRVARARARRASPGRFLARPVDSQVAGAANHRATAGGASAMEPTLSGRPVAVPHAVVEQTNEAPVTPGVAEARPIEVAAPAPLSAPGASPHERDSAVTVLSEAGLLQQARRLARPKPEAALQLLDEHKRRFARGILAPEREVLAIEILRVLSRTAEADARLKAFGEHYPGSVYLHRLKQPSSRP